MKNTRTPCNLDDVRAMTSSICMYPRLDSSSAGIQGDVHFASFAMHSCSPLRPLRCRPLGGASVPCRTAHPAGSAARGQSPGRPAPPRAAAPPPTGRPAPARFSACPDAIRRNFRHYASRPAQHTRKRQLWAGIVTCAHENLLGTSGPWNGLYGSLVHFLA